MVPGFHVSEANSYLVITGAGIEKAMTSEKLQFSLPAVFTIGPEDEETSLMKYAVLLTGDSDGQVNPSKKRSVATGRNHVQEIVKGIIEGETRSIVSNMTMEELFNNRRLFKQQVLDNVQKELDQFGLHIYNANVKELQDMGDSRYFESLARKAHEGAQSQAQVDVAHARMVGRVGEARKEGETKQEVAKINAHTAILETERKVEKANADQKLKLREVEISQELNLSQITAQRAADQRDAELQRAVEEKRAGMELERLRATNVVQAKIARESAQEKANADLYTQTKKADAQQYNQKAEAEAIYYRASKDADAALYKRNRDAEAMLAAREKEAEAMYLMKEREAQAFLVQKEKEAEAMYFTKQREAQALLVQKEKEAEAMYLMREREAQVLLVQKEKEAEAMYLMREREAQVLLVQKEKEAEAHLIMRQREAEASYVVRKKEAEGLTEMAKAYSALAHVFGGPQGLLQYLMLQDNTYQKLADANARAIHGLQPKINVWTTGNQDGGAADSMAPIRNLFQSLPPVLSTIQEQTGIAPPSWLAQMPNENIKTEQAGVVAKAAKKQQALANGP